ncbi:MAG: right-handed parallel beta-helix repeat-containing protein [Bradyrhizobiaceae bacterium]|nr:right-handed parallel beta-helix repeat-containing protein [Bradyrhizobiaceae bacterium]
MKVTAQSALALLIATICRVDAAPFIELSPGDNIAAIVERAPEGATFYLNAGLYRMQSARPKNGQKFIGKGEVIFNGAIVLSDWRKAGHHWIADGPKTRLNPSGYCLKETPLCGHREDLFIGGKLYRRVASRAEVTSGTWLDEDLKAVVFDNPTDKPVELGVMPFAFASEAEGVILQNIIVEKYASAAQYGAIDFLKGRNWELRNVTARWNHGVGARIGPGTRISGGSYSHNGQLGIGGGNGDGIVIENVEIAHNNFAGFGPGWEAGGTKFVRSGGLIVRNACVHNNGGPGLWTDIDNINVEYVDNLVFDNRGDGIKHEISYGAKIHGNTVARNGHENLNWLWGSQILIQNSQDVEVYDNTVEIGAHYGNGIAVINQKRGEGRYGPWVARNNFVHGNTIIHLAAKGFNGMVADHERDWFDESSGNRFERNAYVVPQGDHQYFVVKRQRRKLSELPAYGMERHADIQIEAYQPMKLECTQIR